MRLAFQETANALTAYQKSGEIIAQGSRLVASQKNVSAIALDRFQGGASSYLEVLVATLAGQFSDPISSTTISFSASRFIQQPSRKMVCDGPAFQ